jgi:hypothetical protein
MNTSRLRLVVFIPLFLLCSCASSNKKVIATKHTTLYERTIVAEYPASAQEKDR